MGIESDTALGRPGGRRWRRSRRRLAILILGGIVVGGYLASRIAPMFAVPAPRTRALQEPLPPAETCRDILCQIPWPRFEVGADGRYEQWVGDHRVVYSVDPALQEEALKVFSRYKVKYGALVALEPATGRILAMAEYSEEEPTMEDFCRRATYPAASLIKVITAAAALETGEVTPDTPIRFEGNPYRLYPRKVSPDNARRENNVHTLAEALGKSNNVVFGKVGVNVVGAERLDAALSAFGFNRTIPFDFRLQESTATLVEDRYALARTAAGFGEVYLSPVHAALIAAAVGNRGLMMQPYVVETVQDSSGKELYRAAPAPYTQSLSEAVAAQVAEMMVETVSSGTSSKVFYRYARRLRRNIGVAGKTGSLTGSDPPGKYEWFVGFAPPTDPDIAVASLVVNQGDLWHIKGTYVAQSVLKAFFDF